MLRNEEHVRSMIALLQDRCTIAEEELHRRLFDKLYQSTESIRTDDLKECIRFMKIELKILKWFVCEGVWYF